MSPLKSLLDSPTLQLIRREAAGAQLEFLLLALGAGGANAVLLAVINDAEGSVIADEPRFRALATFAVALAILIICLKRLFHSAAHVFEDAVDRIRVRLVDKTRRADLRTIEEIGESSIYSSLTVDTTTVSQAQGVITTAFQSAVMILFIVIYIAFLSLPLFLISLALVAGGVYINSRQQAETLAAYRETSNTQVRYFGLITDLLDGFKEVKVNHKRAKDLVDDLNLTSIRLRGLMLRTFKAFHGGYVLAQAFFYSLLAALVFIFPRIIESSGETVGDLTATVLFLIGPLSAVVSAIPGIEKTNVAIQNIYQLEHRLDQSLANHARAAGEPVHAMAVPALIKSNDIEFRYYDAKHQTLFAVGPLNFEVPRGKITFVLGGNGSGKSTCLKLLTGLYTPERGYISADDVRIDADNIAEYQALFSVIFSDFQLFGALYGMLDKEPVEVEEMLDKLQIGGKTRYVPPSFTQTELSTGQRKRVALTVALLEDRPILMFDEVAADQDVKFREYFYRTLLPELKAAGKTLVVVSHDDRYYDVADQLIKLEVGRIQSINHSGAAVDSAPRSE